MPTKGRGSRGFTLVEMMIAVAVVSVLAAIAMVGYSRYLTAAHTTEALYMVQGIRAAEEQYRQEGVGPGGYLNVSVSGTYYPQGYKDNGSFTSARYAWQTTTHPDAVAWSQLNLTVDGPVRFGYKVNAGLAGSAMSTTVDFQNNGKGALVWPNPTVDHWYMIQAEGNPNCDTAGTCGANIRMIGSSFTGEVWSEND